MSDWSVNTEREDDIASTLEAILDVLREILDRLPARATHESQTTEQA